MGVTLYDLSIKNCMVFVCSVSAWGLSLSFSLPSFIPHGEGVLFVFDAPHMYTEADVTCISAVSPVIIPTRDRPAELAFCSGSDAFHFDLTSPLSLRPSELLLMYHTPHTHTGSDWGRQ